MERWYISTDGGVTYDHPVTPINGTGDFAYTQDLNAGQIFYRLRMTTVLRFTGTDFKFITRLGRRDRCAQIYIRQQRNCQGQWKDFWTGRFSPGLRNSGSTRYGINYTRCIFEVKAEVVDQYTCLLDHLNDKVNLLQVGPVTANVTKHPQLVFGICRTPSNNPCDFEVCEEFCVGHVGDPEWEKINSQPYDGDWIHIYARELFTSICVNGVPVEPSGGGWELLEDRCDTDGTAVYARTPQLGTLPVIPGTCENGFPMPPEDACDGMWHNVNGCGGLVPTVSPQPDDLPVPPLFVCIQGDQVANLTQTRTLYDCLAFMLEKAGCGLAGIVSDFFEWNPPGAAAGYLPGANYVTGIANAYSHLLISQKSDVLTPTATEHATIGEMTLKELFNFLLSMRVYWDIDKSGNLRLEHWKFHTYPVGLDITTNYRTTEPFETDTDNSDIPNRETFKWMESQDQDFTGADIIYSSACVSRDGDERVKAHPQPRVTTDVLAVIASGGLNDGQISKDGFVVLACRQNGDEFEVLNGTGALSGNSITNAPLAWANLHRDLWTWDRYLPTGNMNRQDVTFDGFLPTVRQARFSVLNFCCDIVKFDPKKSVKSFLGEQYLEGTHGKVEQATITDHGVLELILRYAF